MREVMKFFFPEWHERLTSTNTVLAERLKVGEELPSGFVLAAREQTAGRGRYERKWVSRSGRDLTFSFLLRPRVDFPRLLSLPMATALGVAVALEAFGIEVRTKWPNDLLVGGRKICGILAECGEGLWGEESAVVVGVGLNVNMDQAEAREIDRPVTSMRIETGREYAIEEILGRVLQELSGWIEGWEKAGFFCLRNGWESRCAHMGDYITVGEGGSRRSGMLEGFGQTGQLLLREDDGQLREIWDGDLKP